MTLPEISATIAITIILSGALATVFRKLWLTETLIEIFTTNDTLDKWLTKRMLIQSLKENETVKELRNRVSYLEKENNEVKESIRDLIVTDAGHVYNLKLDHQMLFKYLRQHYDDIDRVVNTTKEGIEIDTKTREFIKSYIDRKLLNSGIQERVRTMKVDKDTFN